MKLSTVLSVAAISLLHGKTTAEYLVVDWQYGGDYNVPITLNTGDTIEFNNIGYHDLVIMENEDKFNDCDFTGGVTLFNQVYTNSGEEETVYFGCSIGDHCPRNAGNMIQEVVFVTPAEYLVVDWQYGGDYNVPITLNTGDTIEFINIGFHDLVIMENEDKFNDCDFTGGVTLFNQVYTNSGEEETVYFGCSIGNHCPRNAGNMKQEVVFGAPCAQDDDKIVALLTPGIDVFLTCGQLSGVANDNPQYVDPICSLDPRSVAESLAPATQCPNTCGDSSASEDPSSEIMILLNSGTDVARITCGALASTANEDIIRYACDFDLTVWDDLIPSTQCCEICA